jgi:hypothetical protein
MREMVVNFDEIQKTLEPFFGNRLVRIIVEDKGATISVDKPEKKLSARGAFREYANPAMIPGEKGAWERAVVELLHEYAKQNDYEIFTFDKKLQNLLIKAN